MAVCRTASRGRDRDPPIWIQRSADSLYSGYIEKQKAGDKNEVNHHDSLNVPE